MNKFQNHDINWKLTANDGKSKTGQRTTLSMTKREKKQDAKNIHVKCKRHHDDKITEESCSELMQKSLKMRITMSATASVVGNINGKRTRINEKEKNTLSWWAARSEEKMKEKKTFGKKEYRRSQRRIKLHKILICIILEKATISLRLFCCSDALIALCWAIFLFLFLLRFLSSTFTIARFGRGVYNSVSLVSPWCFFFNVHSSKGCILLVWICKFFFVCICCAK